MASLEIQFMGTRGSIAVDSEEYNIYGGATISTLVKDKKENIIFDAGSGFMNISKYIDFTKEEKNLHIFISHAHFDHIMGLMVCDIMFNTEFTVNIYGVSRNNLTIKDQINKLMSPPIWPVGCEAFKAKVIFHELSEEVIIGDFSIKSINGNHPGGSSVFKLLHNQKSLIYATDYEILDDNIDPLINFSKNADLIIFDGQYSKEEIKHKIGYGHSSWQDAAILSQKANCKKLCIFHHDPYSTDEYLLKCEKELKLKYPNYSFAKKGEIVVL